MRITWDAPLVTATAVALDRAYRTHRIRATHLDPVARRFTVYLREATLSWELHPERTGFLELPPADPPPEATPLPARWMRCWAPPDERILIIETRRVRGSPSEGKLVVELVPTQENALRIEGREDTIRALLRTREGDRPLRRGQPYALPGSGHRRRGASDVQDVSLDAWREVLEPEAGPARKRALLRTFAWTSPLVAAWILGTEESWPDDDTALTAGHRRWRDLVAAAHDPGEGWVLTGRHGPQPYPMGLPDRVQARAPDLLAAFRQAGSMGGGTAPAPLLPGALVQRLTSEVERARGRLARLEEEWAGLDDPDRLQRLGDLLLARFHQVPSGADEVRLEGFDGSPVTVSLDPTLGPHENARRLYDRAGRLRRARDELPERIRDARARWRSLEALLGEARAGGVDRAEVEEALPPAPSGSRGEAEGPSLPYRRYRSSGGLEIRVGRGAGRNDDLTFRHSRPDDIWLHARHSAGAHVILRWRGEGSPPAPDLYEAGVLAALHSRSRTSGTVPVDWTRRKHVRKPRKAPAGAVVPDRVKTVFVEPDPSLEARLRVDPGDPSP